MGLLISQLPAEEDRTLDVLLIDRPSRAWKHIYKEIDRGALATGLRQRARDLCLLVVSKLYLCPRLAFVYTTDKKQHNEMFAAALVEAVYQDALTFYEERSATQEGALPLGVDGDDDDEEEEEVLDMTRCQSLPREPIVFSVDDDDDDDDVVEHLERTESVEVVHVRGPQPRSSAAPRAAGLRRSGPSSAGTGAMMDVMVIE